MDKKRIIVILTFIVVFIICIILSSAYYKNKYSVYFETGTNDVFLTKYVSKGDKISEPNSPIKDGYVFKEWQLNGEKYDFNSTVLDDTILTAKWIKEEYINVTFKIGEDDYLEPVKVLKGDKVDVLPIVSKTDYNFDGWYLGDELYVNQELYSDTELLARFTEIEKEPIYKVGDSIIIIGEYSNCSYSEEAIHRAAIGWERQILAIIDDASFPYVIGDETGVTGYFKAESIKLK